MGPSINGLDSLVKKPYGCGEQNMITFTPNIFVRRYLERMNKITPHLRVKTNEFMLMGRLIHCSAVIAVGWLRLCSRGLLLKLPKFSALMTMGAIFKLGNAAMIIELWS